VYTQKSVAILGVLSIQVDTLTVDKTISKYNIKV
jgi:hypothetical protein